jgi:hypothetical protein
VSQVEYGVHGIVIGQPKSIDQRIDFLHHLERTYGLLNQLLASTFHVDELQGMRVDESEISRLQLFDWSTAFIVRSGLTFLRER